MKSTMTHLSRAVMVLLIASPQLAAQELEAVWDEYLRADASLKMTVERELEYQAQQGRLQTEIRELQESRSWYNGWINEYLLARKSAQQLELADSLVQIKGRNLSTQQRKEAAFQVLKQVYEEILLGDNASESLSTVQKEQAVALGQSLLARSESQLNLPDYSAILAEQYENAAIRDMVFNDLQVVLRTKLTAIDELVAEKQQEISLLNRLNEFHYDLSLQIESDRDIRGVGESDPSYATGPVDLAEDNGGITFLDGEESGPARTNEIADQDYLGAVRRNISETDLEELSLNPDPLYHELRRLSSISQQYQNLLQQLESQLSD